MSSIFGNAQGMQSAVVTLQQGCRPEMVKPGEKTIRTYIFWKLDEFTILQKSKVKNERDKWRTFFLALPPELPPLSGFLAVAPLAPPFCCCLGGCNKQVIVVITMVTIY